MVTLGGGLSQADAHPRGRRPERAAVGSEDSAGDESRPPRGAAQWAARWSQRKWALEDCRHVSRRFEADLLAAGELVVRVPSKLTGGARKVARTSGKSDPIDALAVARAALREPDLPVAKLEGAGREVRLLLDHREDLVGERTRIQNRLRWHLHELEPEAVIPARMLSRYHTLAELEGRLRSQHGVVVEIAIELVFAFVN